MLIEKEENEKKFYKASIEGNAEEVRRLVYDQLVDVNLCFDKEEEILNWEEILADSTALIAAVRKGHNQVVRILLDAGADIERADKWSHCPLQWAVIDNHYETVKLLLDAGADVNKEDKLGRTSLLWAESKDMVDVLMEHGARLDLEEEDNYNQTSAS